MSTTNPTEEHLEMSPPAMPDEMPTVLLVAERGNELDALTLLLAREGYRVVRTYGNQDCLAVFARERPQVVVLAESNLETTGIDVIRRLRAADPTVPVIMQSRGQDRSQRRRIVHEFELHGVQTDADDPEHLLELIATAVSGSRRLERALADHERRAVRLTKLCNGLRTSMHVIHGYAQILRAGSASAPVEEVVARLSSASEGALELLRNHLGQASLEPTPPAVPVVRERVRHEIVNIDELVRGVCADAARHMNGRPLRVRSAVAWPSAFIRTDAQKLRAILSELLDRAVSATPAGNVHLAVQFSAHYTDFVVRDGDAALLDDNDRVLGVPPSRPVPAFPVAPATAEPMGLDVAVRLSAAIGALLTTHGLRGSGPIFTLRLPAAAMLQPSEPSSSVH
jgi:signal transduction histidine kinase